MGDRFLSSAGAGGNCARPVGLQDPGPILDKNRAPMGPEILSSTGAGVWRKAPLAFSDSSSVLDKFQSARQNLNFHWEKVNRQGQKKNMSLVKQCLCPRDTCHFRHFRVVFTGLRIETLVFSG